MKKLIVILTMILAFTACGQAEAENADTQPSVSPTPESEFVTVDSAVNILSTEKIKILKSQGVIATVVGKTGEDKTYICLEKGDHQLMIEYDYNNPITLNYWGGHIVVVQPDGLEYYYIDDFHYVDTFTVTDFEGRLIDAIPHGHGFIAAYINGEEYGLAKFRASGGFMYKLPLDIHNPFVDENGKIIGKTYLTYIDKNQYYTDQSQKKLLFTSNGIDGKYDSFIYDLSEKTAHYFRVIAKDPNDNGGVYMTAAISEYDGLKIRDDIPAKIFRLYNGDPTGYIEFDAGMLIGGFFDFDGVEVIYPDENTVQFRSLDSDHIITADFAKGKASSTISKRMIENGLERLYTNSADGKYSLWKGNGEGGGDVVINSIYLVENATGKVKYIDTIGGMYGGSESAGFFSNGDVYTIGLDEFKVFTTDMSQEKPVFEMSKNFPLGDDAVGKGSFRHLLAARRDPATHSWVVLYNEGKEYENYADNFVDYEKWSDNFYKSTYKVGILDPQGNLTKMYDSGEHVMTYAFRQVKMYMAEGDILNFEVVIKGKETQLHGQLDLNTGEYTCISGGYNQWNKN